jgi:hypothetical protein
MSAKSIGSMSQSEVELNAAKDFFGGLLAERRSQARIAGGHATIDSREYAPMAIADLIQNELEPDQFARDIREIERTAAALREGEPDLEPWTTGVTGAAAALDQPKPRSVWLFVGTIWITTVLVTGAATLAITSLL